MLNLVVVVVIEDDDCDVVSPFAVSDIVSIAEAVAAMMRRMLVEAHS